MEKSRILGLFLFIPFVLLCIFLYSSKTRQSFLLQRYQIEENEFQSFMKTYNKYYSSEEEYNFRFSTFKDNLSYIKRINSLSKDWILAVNSFADLTQSEFTKTYTSSIQETQFESLVFNNEKPLTIPVSVDWRSKGIITPVRNQENCACGWAFAAVGAVEAVWALAGHKLVELSEQQLIDCSSTQGNKGCNGGSSSNAFKYIQANGIANLTSYPYVAENGRCEKTAAAKIVAKISTFAGVTPNSALALKTAVALQPVAVGVDADASVWQFYSKGTVTANCGTNLNHTVLLVGYNTAPTVPYFIAKNSWGPVWGNDGFIQLGIIDGPGVCGLQISPYYPSV